MTSSTPAVTEPTEPALGRHGRSRRRLKVPAGRSIQTLLLAFLLASLLCSTGLEHIAERQPFGTTRDVALDVTRPLHSVSHSLYLDRPEQWLETLAGRRDQPVANVLLPAATTAPARGTATGPADPTASTGPAVDGVTSTTVLAAPAHRTPTAAAPLKVLMAGDSLIGNISQAVARQYGKDPRISLRTDLQVGTGLARPDVLDWGAELSTVLDADPTDVVILSFGANDDQPLRDPQGHFLSLFSDGWAKEYARRVSAIIDLASGGGRRTVIWIGLPPERPDRLNEAKDTFNTAASSQAALRTDVHYVDLVPVFGGPAAAYSDTVTLPDGSIVDARDTDGVHLSHDGANLVAPILYQTLAGEWHLTG